MRNYIPALDGLRAIAILIVMASHYGGGHFIPGGFGVTLFFFISGYLITSILIDEHEGTGSISIGSFYARRFLRLAPALLFMIAGVSVIYAALIGPVSGPQLLAAVLYLMNYFEIYGGLLPMPLGVLWSLAVEEHYYLVFPVLFTVGWRRPSHFLAALVALTAIILAWRLILVLHFHASESRTYLATDTRIDSILYGAILAAIYKARHTFWLSKPFVILGSTATILLTLLFRDQIFRETWRYTLQGIALMPLLYSLLSAKYFSPIRNILESAPLVWLGRLSYSLYLWHFAVLYFFQKTSHLSEPAKYVAAMFVSLFAAGVSFYFVEQPFQSLRKRFRVSGDTRKRGTTSLSCDAG